MFADDVKIFVSFALDNQPLQSDFEKGCSWRELSRMQLNVDKCKCMSLCRQQIISYPYNISGTPLSRVCSFGDLGFVLEPKLRFHIHVEAKLESVQKQFLLFCLLKLAWDPLVRRPPYKDILKLIYPPNLFSIS